MNTPEETDMNDMGWNDMTKKKTVYEKLHLLSKQSIPQECVGISKMGGVTWKSKPGKIRRDDVSSMEPAGPKTSWRERYQNECTVTQSLKYVGNYGVRGGWSEYVHNINCADVTGGQITGRLYIESSKHLITFNNLIYWEVSISPQYFGLSKWCHFIGAPRRSKTCVSKLLKSYQAR